MTTRACSFVCLVSFSALVVGGCWANFPESRLVDGSTGQTDWISPPSDTGPLPDTGPLADGNLPPDARVDQNVASCKANAFIGCVNNAKAYQRCNKQGDGIITVDCKGASCDSQKGRCDQCDPLAASTCVKAGLRQCSPSGLFQIKLCPLGCAAGACCTDQDRDSFSCNDCNDKDQDVFPGQQNYFDRAANGSFDYNCDRKDEPEFPAQVACSGMGKCSGEGWAGGVPACGKEGQFAACAKVQGKCRPEAPRKRKQRCR